MLSKLHRRKNATFVRLNFFWSPSKWCPQIFDSSTRLVRPTLRSSTPGYGTRCSTARPEEKISCSESGRIWWVVAPAHHPRRPSFQRSGSIVRKRTSVADHWSEELDIRWKKINVRVELFYQTRFTKLKGKIIMCLSSLICYHAFGLAVAGGGAKSIKRISSSADKFQTIFFNNTVLFFAKVSFG